MVSREAYYVCAARSEGMGPTGVEMRLVIPVKKPNIIVAFCLWQNNISTITQQIKNTVSEWEAFENRAVSKL